MAQPEQPILCPACGATPETIAIGQATWNTQAYHPKIDDWGDSWSSYEDEAAYSAECAECGADMTDVLAAHGWMFEHEHRIPRRTHQLVVDDGRSDQALRSDVERATAELGALLDVVTRRVVRERIKKEAEA